MNTIEPSIRMSNEATAWTLVFGAWLVAGIATLGALVYKNGKIDQSAQLAEGNRAHLVRMHSPTLGKADAPVVIVEFLDPACETCRAFYPLGKQIMAANPARRPLGQR